MLVAAYILTGTLALLFLFVCAISRISYRIGSKALEIRLLGIPLRKIPLSKIRRISKHQVPKSEKWPNTVFPSKRILYLELATKSPSFLMITPDRRYVFKAKLKRAVYYAKKAEHLLAENEPEPSENPSAAEDDE